MLNNRKKLIFYLLYFSSFLIIPYVLFSNTPFSLVISNKFIFVGFLQRLFGLLAFMALFYQIILGAYMVRITEKLGAFIYDLHISQGVVIYITILLHPLLLVVYKYMSGKGLDPIYVFAQICLICQNKGELYYTFGRVAFWLINITVFVGLLRTLNPFLRANWKKVHVLNYIVFFAVGVHGYFVGSDFSLKPFLYFVIFSTAVVFYILITRKIPEFIEETKKWLKKD